jgi:hypothetical protein
MQSQRIANQNHAFWRRHVFMADGRLHRFEQRQRDRDSRSLERSAT